MVKLGQLQLVVVMLFTIRNVPGGAPLFLELQALDAVVWCVLTVARQTGFETVQHLVSELYF